MHMFGIFKDVAVDVGLQPNPAMLSKSRKTLTKKDLQKRDLLTKSIKVSAMSNALFIHHLSNRREILKSFLLSPHPRRVAFN